ncbi:MAG: DUF4935 domain-containing protein [Rhodopirellula sp.]|nr:DUF4935 domain-containing protein [Rhodopirellula sp.]
MKNKFHQYYRPTPEEFESIWNEGCFVFDANVLLNLYTYSEETTEEILTFFDSLNGRVWLPYQAAEEYHRNRCKIISNESIRYSQPAKTLRTVLDELGARAKHPFIAAELFERFRGIVEEMERALSSGKTSHRRLIQEDQIRDRLTELFDGAVGEPFSTDILETIYAEGASRYSSKIPPGYCDDDKPEPGRYGDLARIIQSFGI